MIKIMQTIIPQSWYYFKPISLRQTNWFVDLEIR